MAYCVMFEFHVPLSEFKKMSLREKAFYYVCLLVKADKERRAADNCQR